jgi:hypothetical protein
LPVPAPWDGHSVACALVLKICLGHGRDVYDLRRRKIEEIWR